MAAAAVWLGIVLLGIVSGPLAADESERNRLQNLPPFVPWALISGGAVLVVVSISLLGASMTPPSVLSLLIAITLAGWHALNYAAFEIGKGYTERDMTAYVELQEREFASEADGYTAVKHQREVGAGYFDQIATVVSGGNASTLALEGSTEEEQFH